ncbi:MAG: GDP-mannose 4,6-dehydratase [Berkelbacteria bacterium GW2011_GWA1_36_9]|uniref:GDP-mannose 4,6-dehydratase n=1 Tax=Berkelbacteria bacterium GW2011_GWA1_36_9 TaxID=1618331 RepID=A0A0G0IPK5_9BACT|nr:MAG: GDP-mannose 4,6-dehydratase [Berkelbacteria bacterium GW2011_GWA1_36_9]
MPNNLKEIQPKKQKIAFITGITGQDGSYLADFLLEKGYKVFGMVRRTSTPNLERISHILDKIELVYGDLIDQSSITALLQEIQPDEIYNLAAQSFVKDSWNEPLATGEFTGLGVLRVLEAMRQACPKAKFYQASSSEMFGSALAPQNEKTKFEPRSPYAVSKVFGHYITINYRESYGLFACSGILFNHESPRRGIEFVTRKITDGVARIKLGLADELKLGNLDAKRDWGFAGDYIKAMWLMLQQDKPNDYVIGTGINHTVRDFVEVAFKAAGIKEWEKYVKVDPKFLRPAEVVELKADITKAKKKLGWEPETDFNSLVKMMVEADTKRLLTERVKKDLDALQQYRMG